MKHSLTLAVAAALMLAAPMVPEVAAAEGGNALVFPKRVVFAGRTRSAEVNLVNRSSRPVTYRVELVDRRMTPFGALAEIDPPSADERSARGLLRYAPRQVVVPPESSQKIRLLLRKPADLAVGEYRSHLLCRALPPPDAGFGLAALEDGKSVAVRLTALPAVSIPVIVRHGEVSASARLSDLTFDSEAAPELSFRLDRAGEASIYGDLTASWISPAGGETVVARVKGVAVYATLPAVHLRLALSPPAGTALAGGRLRLSFHSRPEDDGGGPPVTTEAEIDLPPRVL